MGTVERVLWLVGGCAFALVLGATLDDALRPRTSVAFALLCFCCGALAVGLLVLRKAHDDFSKQRQESIAQWAKEFEELRSQRDKLKAERDVWEADRDESVRKAAFEMLQHEMEESLKSDEESNEADATDQD